MQKAAYSNSGLAYIGRGLELIRTKGLRRYVVVPILTNLILFSLAFTWLYGEVDYWLNRFMSWLPDFFQWLEQHAKELNQQDPAALTYAIQRSCEIKAEVVALDEREKGLRALLNLGHTFGHAIEAATEYGAWTHGEAVAAGIIIASKLSEVTQRLNSSDFRRIKDLLLALSLPTKGPQMPWQDWLDYMQRDKKVKDGQLHFVLPVAIGQAEVVSTVEHNTVTAVITECC